MPGTRLACDLAAEVPAQSPAKSRYGADTSQEMRGEDAGLERVPVPETLFVHLLHVARHSTDRSLLRWIATFFLQLLGWLRGNSVGGLQPGDVRFD